MAKVVTQVLLFSGVTVFCSLSADLESRVKPPSDGVHWCLFTPKLFSEAKKNLFETLQAKAHYLTPHPYDFMTINMITTSVCIGISPWISHAISHQYTVRWKICQKFKELYTVLAPLTTAATIQKLII